MGSSIAVRMLDSNFKSLTLLYMSGAERILWYFKGTEDQVMMICLRNDDPLTAFVDASWGITTERTEDADLV